MEIKSLEQYNEIVASGVTLVDFYANWCGPCKMLAPIIEELEHDFAGRANVIKVDVDQFPEIAQQFNVMNIPTLIVLKNNQQQAKLIGYKGKDVLVNAIEEVL